MKRASTEPPARSGTPRTESPASHPTHRPASRAPTKSIPAAAPPTASPLSRSRERGWGRGCLLQPALTARTKNPPVPHGPRCHRPCCIRRAAKSPAPAARRSPHRHPPSPARGRGAGGEGAYYSQPSPPEQKIRLYRTAPVVIGHVVYAAQRKAPLPQPGDHRIGIPPLPLAGEGLGERVLTTASPHRPNKKSACTARPPLS